LKGEEKIMDNGRLKSIVSALGNCELTPLERQFLGRVKEYFEENDRLTEQQESILEGIFREKIRWMKIGVQREEVYTTKKAM
jgi:hypothetical protein